LIYWSTVSAASFDCRCSSINSDCKSKFLLKTLNYKGKSSLHCDCLRLWQHHSNTRCNLWTNALFVLAGGGIAELIIASVFVGAVENFGLFQNPENLFWMKQTWSQLRYDYHDISQYLMQTHILPLIHSLISFLKSQKQEYLLFISLLNFHFLWAFAKTR